MKSRILMQFVFSTALLLGASSGAQAADPIKVSASFSILGDMVKQVGSRGLRGHAAGNPRWCRGM
jgi:ABC-type Zn uptake system ZnuABC Zn-binding protein ZnuA